MRDGLRGSVRTLLREPLLHFLVLGAALFVLFRFAPTSNRGGSGGEPSEIVVTSGQIDHIIDVFSKTRRRPPSPAELKGLVDDHVLGEVLYREAIALGLDQGDTIIRRRLRQKMEFLADDLAEGEASEEELGAFLKQHPERFRDEAKSTFEHIVFRPGSGQHAERLLEKLKAGETVDVATAGDPVPLPASFEAAREGEIRAQFGDRFTEQLAELGLGVWRGPVESPYGRHLVRVRERVPGRVPELGEIRAVVEREWLAQRRQAAQDAWFRELRSRYVVTLQGGVSEPSAPSAPADPAGAIDPADAVDPADASKAAEQE